jgi:hypothetical protein
MDDALGARPLALRRGQIRFEHVARDRDRDVAHRVFYATTGRRNGVSAAVHFASSSNIVTAAFLYVSPPLKRPSSSSFMKNGIITDSASGTHLRETICSRSV